MDTLGIDVSSPNSRGAQSSQGGKGKSGRGGRGQQPTTSLAEEFTFNRESRFGLELMKRLKDELDASKVMDAVMRPSADPDLAVVIALGTEFMPEGALDTLLSGVFTVVGKVTQIVEGDDEISLYRRTAFSYLGNHQLDSTLEKLPGVNPAYGQHKARSP